MIRDRNSKYRYGLSCFMHDEIRARLVTVNVVKHKTRWMNESCVRDFLRLLMMPIPLTRRITYFFGYAERLSFLYSELPAYQNSLHTSTSAQRTTLRMIFRRYVSCWPEDGQRALRLARLYLDVPSRVQVAVLTSVSKRDLRMSGAER